VFIMILTKDRDYTCPKTVKRFISETAHAMFSCNAGAELLNIT
jgi:hypothetical protein